MAGVVGVGADGRVDAGRSDADADTRGPVDEPVRRRDTGLSTVVGRRVAGVQVLPVAAGDAALLGAAPIPVATPGAGTGGDVVVAGAPPTDQPTVMANGSPKATMPRNMDLGESLTPEHRSGR